MSAAIPLFKEVWFRAQRERREIICLVLMADDSVRNVRFGPRGGWQFA